MKVKKRKILMTRYDLIVKRVDGCASARVEKHELGAFVKYAEVMERIAELEKELSDSQTPDTELEQRVTTIETKLEAIVLKLKMTGIGSFNL